MKTSFQVAAAAVALAVAAGTGVAVSQSKTDVASAPLVTAGGTQIGTVGFGPDRSGTRVTVDLNIPVEARNTASNFQGFHIHANNDPSNGEGCQADAGAARNTWFVSADGHWKEGNENHGDHRGDMPPLYIDRNGRASASFVMDQITPPELRGKAVILHAGADNLGNVPVGTAPNQYAANSPAAITATQNTGNAGDRVACGLVAIP